MSYRVLNRMMIFVAALKEIGAIISHPAFDNKPNIPLRTLNRIDWPRHSNPFRSYQNKALDSCNFQRMAVSIETLDDLEMLSARI